MTPEQVIGLYQESVDINDCARRVAESSERELSAATRKARESAIEECAVVADNAADGCCGCPGIGSSVRQEVGKYDICDKCGERYTYPDDVAETLHYNGRCLLQSPKREHQPNCRGEYYGDCPPYCGCWCHEAPKRERESGE